MTHASDVQQVADWLAAAERAVVFTGAGISTESGLPDFRSPGGIWATSTPVLYQDFLKEEEARHEYWRQKAIAHRDFAACEPNVGHRILADWETRGRIRGILTQNIDELHQQAGSQTVVELHGTARRVDCLDCDQQFPAGPLVDVFLATDEVPACPACGSRLMKHATISFGQSLRREVLWQATKLSKEADLFLALGSSLVVQPAAAMPSLAKEHGARLVIINRDPTPMDEWADVLLPTPLGETLQEIDALLKK